MAGLAAHPLLAPEGVGVQAVGVLRPGDVTQQAALVGPRVGDVGVVRPEPRKEERPVGGQPPVGMGVAALEPLHVLEAVLGAAVAVAAHP